MHNLKNIKKYLKNPKNIIYYIKYRYFVSPLCRSIPDKKYLEKVYYFRTNEKLNLDNPKTFNEKLQWLKLYNRKDIFTKMVDKYDVKKIVSEKIGDNYVIPVYQVCEKYDDIDFSKLPQKFVIKTTHDCGGVVICKDKTTFNNKRAKKIINRHLRKNYYYSCREWPYKNIKPRIIVEEFMENKGFDYLPVYKFFCFNGVPKIIQTIQNDKQPNETIDYFDVDWNLLDMRQNFPNSEKPLEKPQKLSEMLEIAENLSMDLPFIRVDLYVINNDIYFSEYTFFSDAGFERFTPDYWNIKLGDMLELPLEAMQEK